MSTELKTDADGTDGEIKAERAFEARFGRAIASRGVAAIPALLLRWQSRLRLKDGHIVLLSTVFSFYRSPIWPSVSIEKMAKWRGISRKRIDKEINELEALGYLVRCGRDPKYGSYVFDLTGLLHQLGLLAYTEAELEELRRAQSQVFARAFPDLSTARPTNREQEQRTRTKRTGTEKFEQRPLPEDANSVHAQKLTVENMTTNPIEITPATSRNRESPSSELPDLFDLASDDSDETVEGEALR